MAYYPETTVIMPLARVQRSRRLPPQAIPRPTHTVAGQTVEAINTVLEGDILRSYLVLDVAEFFRLKDAAKAATLIEIEAGQHAQMGQELARKGRNRRAKVLHSPVDGQVVRIDGHRIIMQVSEKRLEVQARIPGEVEIADAKMVRIAGTGALIQCAWGNGQFVFGTLRFVPDEGFVALSKMDVRISDFRGVVLISPAPLNKGDLLVAQQHETAGVVAPCMPSSLREFALKLDFPVLLTEGFGQRRPTALIYRLLQSNIGRQAAFDAALPSRWAADRPEIMIPLPSGGQLPPVPALDQVLEKGARVRLLRAPWEGLIGTVVELPAAPQQVESGLRVACARVRLPSDRIVNVPLANLELTGDLPGASA